jgi:hypothetical protein
MPNAHLWSQFASKWDIRARDHDLTAFFFFVACIVAIIGVKFNIGLDIFGLHQDSSGIDAI